MGFSLTSANEDDPLEQGLKLQFAALTTQPSSRANEDDPLEQGLKPELLIEPADESVEPTRMIH